MFKISKVTDTDRGMAGRSQRDTLRFTPDAPKLHLIAIELE